MLLLLALPAVVQAQYNYTTNNNTITIISGYTGSGGALTIPSTIDGLPVTSIGEWAFQKNIGPTSVTIPSSITWIGDYAFYGCTSLTGVNCQGNAPSYGSYVFASAYILISSRRCRVALPRFYGPTT